MPGGHGGGFGGGFGGRGGFGGGFGGGHGGGYGGGYGGGARPAPRPAARPATRPAARPATRPAARAPIRVNNIQRNRFFVGRAYSHWPLRFGGLMLPAMWGIGFPLFFFGWPLYMQFYWLYYYDMMYSTTVAMQYLQSQRISQDEMDMMKAQSAGSGTANVTVDEQTVKEYIELIKDPETPDSVIEKFFQKKGLTDDQIVLMQQKAVKEMGDMPEAESRSDVPGGSSDEGRFCSYCGFDVSPFPGAVFCPDCGVRLESQ